MYNKALCKGGRIDHNGSRPGPCGEAGVGSMYDNNRHAHLPTTTEIALNILHRVGGYGIRCIDYPSDFYAGLRIDHIPPHDPS